MTAVSKARDDFMGQRVPHSYSSDGKLRYGDTIVLASSSSAVTTDVFSKEISGSRFHDEKATASNTLVLTRDEKATTIGLADSSSDVLRYGDVFYLTTNPSLNVDPEMMDALRPCLYLSSEARGVSSGLSQTQNCFAASNESRDARWKILPRNTRKRATLEGTPVPSNKDVSLCHVATNALLSIRGRNITLSSLRKDSEASFTAVRFVTSKDPRDAEDKRVFREMTPDLLLEKIRRVVSQRVGGFMGVRALTRSFQSMDAAGDGFLDRDDFSVGLSRFGVQLSNQESDMLVSAFDKDRDGLVSCTEFLTRLRGPMSTWCSSVSLLLFFSQGYHSSKSTLE